MSNKTAVLILFGVLCTLYNGCDYAISDSIRKRSEVRADMKSLRVLAFEWSNERVSIATDDPKFQRFLEVDLGKKGAEVLKNSPWGNPYRIEIGSEREGGTLVIVICDDYKGSKEIGSAMVVSAEGIPEFRELTTRKEIDQLRALFTSPIRQDENSAEIESISE